MRIGIDYTAAIRQGAGVGRFVRSLVGALLAIDRENSYNLFYSRANRSAPAPTLPFGPNVVGSPLRLPERALNLLWYKLGVPVPIEAMGAQADLFHFLDFVIPPVRHGSVVLTVHDLSFLLVPECAEAGLRTHLERAVPQAVRQADFVTADSENTRNELTTLLDVPPDRVDVVYGGVDPRFAPIADEMALEAIRLKYGLFYPFVLYLGTIEPRKNLTRLLQAYRLLRRQGHVRHRLVLGGGLGWLYQDVLREIDEMAADEEVVFLGRIPDDDLPALYNLCDFFVFPSLYEGFGLPPLEAMACGRAVVCSNTSSLPEVIGDAGLLVSPYDVEALAAAMGELAANCELRTRLGQRGIERAASFTWDRSARRLLDVYQRVVTG